MAQSSKQPIHCFEEGRVFNGFRHVFPLWYRERFVGTVEISFDAKAIIEDLEKALPIYGELWLPRASVEEKVWPSERKNYRPTLASDTYLIDLSARGMQTSTARKLATLIPKISGLLGKEIQKKLSRHEMFSHHLAYQGKSYLFVFLPIKNCRNTNGAYLMLMMRSPFFEKNNDYFIALLTLAVILNLLAAAGLFLYLWQEDISLHALETMAATDPLTGLANRRTGMEYLERIVSKSTRHDTPASLLFFDLDHFKRLNDRWGHDFGDKVLTETARLVSSLTRKEDLAARWGGEEFIVVADETTPEEARSLAEKIRRAVAGHDFGNGAGSVTISVGVAGYRRGEKVASWIKRADEMLYKAKEKGRNRVEIWKEEKKQTY
ncbi:GGDEF domain-containing protein [Hydrogenimonas sp.]